MLALLWLMIFLLDILKMPLIMYMLIMAPLFLNSVLNLTIMYEIYTVNPKNNIYSHYIVWFRTGLIGGWVSGCITNMYIIYNINLPFIIVNYSIILVSIIITYPPILKEVVDPTIQSHSPDEEEGLEIATAAEIPIEIPTLKSTPINVVPIIVQHMEQSVQMITI